MRLSAALHCGALYDPPATVEVPEVSKTICQSQPIALLLNLHFARTSLGEESRVACAIPRICEIGKAVRPGAGGA